MASERPTVVVAYSGGLDTSFLVARYARTGHRVVACTVDTGGFEEGELEAIERRARALGAERWVGVDAQAEVFDRYVTWLLKANVLRGGVYPLSVAAERYAQAEKAIEVARAEKARAIVHGSTGAGNDQVRFDISFRVLAPEIEVWAPVRDEGLTREQEKAWLEKEGLAGLLAKSKAQSAYSVNAGLWGTTAGGGELHDPWEPAGEEAWPLVTAPWDAADLPEELDVEFTRGVPTAVCGQACDGPGLTRQLNKIGRRHGVGRGVHVGDTVLGLKGRIAFEAPAALILLAAHRELEKIVLTGRQLLLKEQLGLTYGDYFHRGLYHEPVMRDLEAFLDSSQRAVTGTARVRLYRGNLDVLGVQSPFSLMDPEIGRYGESARLWDGRDARGFARLLGIPSEVSARRDRKAAARGLGGQ